jgi:TonB family protein
MTGRIGMAVAALVLFAATAGAQDALAPVRDLFASAAYEEALTAVTRLKASANTAEVAELDRYRVLCLMALGRTAEADKVIESIVANDPMYQPSAADASPRVRAAFTAVRQRVLPSVARSLYVDAKAAFNRKAYAEAVTALEKTIAVIDSIDGAGEADFSDLKVLASGFLDLSRASLAPPAAAAPPAATNTAKPEPPRASAPPPLTTNLVVLRQTVPALPFALASVGTGEYRGVVEVEIDEAGNVTNAKMIEPIHAAYDPMLLRAARDWKYEPPRIGGKPSVSRKRVEIVLKP